MVIHSSIAWPVALPIFHSPLLPYSLCGEARKGNIEISFVGEHCPDTYCLPFDQLSVFTWEVF